MDTGYLWEIFRRFNGEIGLAEHELILTHPAPNRRQESQPYNHPGKGNSRWLFAGSAPQPSQLHKHAGAIHVILGQEPEKAQQKKPYVARSPWV